MPNHLNFSTTIAFAITLYKSPTVSVPYETMKTERMTIEIHLVHTSTHSKVQENQLSCSGRTGEESITVFIYLDGYCMTVSLRYEISKHHCMHQIETK